MSATTIKVPHELRDRINHDAGERGLSAAALLTELLDGYERSRRFEAIREAYGRLPEDDTYAQETRLWDETSGDSPADA
ncbi:MULTISPECIES: hypothetical protein [Arthrobacter]|uniref:hypothetical protein n=1 Tax=Arthrobacter TaxID=1663 RepID=UPI00197AC2C8|nr:MULTISPECIES: hypothetical protein [Arthrobacter]MBT8160907.1 hypothetical protein [Arthrobacter sp. GN70]